ncbi:hypothetical protein C4D60_Mb09t06490 [Musa balbisiana]|uniref:Uncharacterized protein n=1 Tax=Musa balbisiana TaxID=52838 RepID=A0A4V4H320_MUSBA|nr:hypothetical protein C4D60_Mb09t06490 [Musa balbisiana]
MDVEAGRRDSIRGTLAAAERNVTRTPPLAAQDEILRASCRKGLMWPKARKKRKFPFFRKIYHRRKKINMEIVNKS